MIQNCKQAKNYTFEEMKIRQYKLDVKLELNESQKYIDNRVETQSKDLIPLTIIIENIGYFRILSFTVKLRDILNREILSKRGLEESLSNCLSFTPEKKRRERHFICPHSLEMNLWEGYTNISFYISKDAINNLELEYEIQTEEDLFFKGTVRS